MNAYKVVGTVVKIWTRGLLNRYLVLLQKFGSGVQIISITADLTFVHQVFHRKNPHTYCDLGNLLEPPAINPRLFGYTKFS